MNTYLESNKERFLNELFELIKIPSIAPQQLLRHPFVDFIINPCFIFLHWFEFVGNFMCNFLDSRTANKNFLAHLYASVRDILKMCRHALMSVPVNHLKPKPIIS